MKKKILDLLPSIIFASLGVVFIIIYSIIGKREATVYLQLLGGMLLCFFFPIIGILTRHRFPTAFNWIVGSFVFLALYIAKGVDGYGLWEYYDKLLHTTFGVVGAIFVYVLIMLWHGDRINLFGKILLVILGTMGLGALWEVFEYICSLLFNVDPQLVQISLDKGINPIQDTMLDMIVTLIGSSAVSIFIVVDYLTKKHYLDRFFEIEQLTAAQQLAIAKVEAEKTPSNHENNENSEDPETTEN